ncbi:hypothetical protein HZS_2166 [Henneguya salminicola]|nr:hypothetical protein HZS_2166 [Henneguya salminicola]
MRINRDGNLFLNNPSIHNHAPTPEDLSKRRIISNARIKQRISAGLPRRLLAGCLNRSSNTYFDSTFKEVPEI